MEKQTVGQKVKGHFKRNRKTYIGIAVGAGLGIIGYKIYSDRRFVELKESVDGLTAKIGDLTNSSSNATGDISAAENANIEINMGNITNITKVVRRGHAGDVIKCIETGEEWGSKKLAIDEIGTTRSTLNKHLKGLIPEIDGKTYAKLGSFNADEQPVGS